MFMYEENTEEQKQLKQIAEARTRLEKQKQIAKDAQYIADLLYKDYVRTCIGFPTKYDCLYPTIKQAWDTQGTDEAKKKNSTFNVLKSMIERDFFGSRKIKITNILQDGYEGYGYNFQIKCEDKIFILVLPIKSKIDYKNFDYAHEGKFYLGYKATEDSCCTQYITTSYLIEDIAEAVEKFLTNQ